MLTVEFGESTMSRRQVQLWYNRFKESRQDVSEDDRPDRPSTSTTNENIEAVKKVILGNRQITIREVPDDVGISFGSCQKIFKNILGMKQQQYFEQKQLRINIAYEMLTTFNDDPVLLKMVITSDEPWMYGYDIETKAQSSQWKRSEEPNRNKHVKFGQM